MELLSRAYVVSQSVPELETGEIDFHEMANAVASVLNSLPEESEARIMNATESRSAPRGMNYQFDEIDPDVDAKTFSRANAARRKHVSDEKHTNRSEREHHRRVAQDAYDRRWGSGDERSEREMMHGTEEEESNMPARRDRMKSISREINTDLDNIHNKSLPSNKRFKQQGKRFDRRMGLNAEEEEAKAPGTRDKMMGFGKEVGDYMRVKNEKRARQKLNRFARRQTGSNHPDYNK